MKRLLLVFLGASALLAQIMFAQNSLRLDLSGNWRAIVADRPEFAQRDFNDTTWRSLQVPTDWYREFPVGSTHWIRRRVELPPTTDRLQLSLTLGAIKGLYEVYVNGAKIGETEGLRDLSAVRIQKAQTFEIPDRNLEVDGVVQIAIRIQQVIKLPPSWVIADEGPWLLTYRAQAPVEAGRLGVERTWMSGLPRQVFGGMFLVVALLSLITWLGDRARKELLWFTIVSLVNVIVAFVSMGRLLADGYQFDASGFPRDEFLLVSLTNPLFGELALAALGRANWHWRTALWLGWLTTPAIVLLQRSVHLSVFLGNAWCGCLVLTLVVMVARKSWAGQVPATDRALHVVLFLRALETAYSWTMSFLGGAASPNFSSEIGMFRVIRSDVVWLAVSGAILFILFRRQAEDRKEQQRLAGELEAARVIQQLLLREPAMRDETLHLDAVYSPAQEVGGDFYYVLDGEVVVLGDVAGKGLKAAMLVSLLVGVLRGISERAPGAVLAALNRAVVGQMEGSFVTCCCVRFAGDGEVTLANAGQLSPYLNGEEVTVPPGLPLGVVALDAYDETVVQIPPGGVLTLVSDGVVEAENARRELFGFDRTRAMSGKSAKEIAEAAKAWGQNDDITVVTVRRNEC